MKNLEKKLRNKVQKIPDKRIRRLLIVSGMLALFAFFDIETLKKIELWGISGIANTVDSVAAPILDIFENGCVKTFVCNGVQREHNKKLNNGLPILHKVPPKRDYGRYFV